MNGISSFRGFGEQVAYFSVIHIYLCDNTSSPVLLATIVSQENFHEVVAASGTSAHNELFVWA